MSKESFKAFVQKNPTFAGYVNRGEMTWQKFYEMYDLYGETDDVWKTYREEKSTAASSSLLGDTSLKEIFNTLKRVDLETVRKGVDGLSKAVGLLQDLSTTKEGVTPPKTYERRPMYRYFED